MGIYNQKVEKLLMETKLDENILHKYDNVTYHIQFFMLPVHIQIEYFNKKNSLVDNDRELNDLLNKNKVIIAETGVGSSINIESLETTVISSNPTLGLSTVVDMTLKLSEIGTGSLVNKIALLSKILGYDGYVTQPYFITIWFSGYEHATKAKGYPISKINNESYTYCVYISENKSEIGDGITTYSMKLVNMTFEGMKKEWSVINNMGNLTFDVGTNFPTAIKNVLEPRLISLYKKTFGENITNMLYKNEKIIEFNFDKTTQFQWKGCDKKITYKSNEKTNLITIINELWNKINGNTGYVPNITYQPILVGSVNNKLYYKLIVNINPIKIPSLKNFIESLYAEKNNKYISNYYLATIETIQENYLKEIHKMNALKRRYFYIHTGKNVDVIDYKQAEDNLWFLNVATNDAHEISLNTFDKIKDFVVSNNVSNYVPNDYIRKINMVRDKTQGKKIFADDVFRILSRKDMTELLKHRYTISTGSLNVIDVQTTNSDDIDNKDPILHKVDDNIEQTFVGIGAENFLSHAQKITLDLTIIGDPYWLEFGSEINQGDIEHMLPHVVLSLSTPMIPDNMDNYKPDDFMKINTLYMIHTITSTFSNGAFTQRLEGTVALPFVQSKNAKAKNIFYNDDGSINKEILEREASKTPIGQKLKKEEKFYNDVATSLTYSYM